MRTIIKKFILPFVILSLLSCAAYANVAQDLIETRANREKASIESIIGRFRSWYQLEKLNGNNPDFMAIPLDVFGDTNYGASHSYSEGTLTLNLAGLPASVLTSLQSIMRLQNINGNLQVSIERDGTNTGASIDTSNLIQRSGGTFLPGANLTFTSGGILMPSSTTLNVKSLNVDGIDISDMSGLTLDGITLKNANNGQVIAGTTDNPVPFRGSICSIDGKYHLTFDPFNGFGRSSNRIYSLGEVDTPFGTFTGTSYAPSKTIFTPKEQNFSIGSILNFSEDGITIGDSNTEDIKFKAVGGVILSSNNDVTIEGGTVYLYGDRLSASGVQFDSDVVFMESPRFKNPVYYDSYIITDNLTIDRRKKLTVGGLELSDSAIKGSRVDIKANSLKINGKNVVTSDSKVLVSLNKTLPSFNFSKSTSSSLSSTFDIEGAVMSGMPGFNNNELGGTPVQYELSAGIRNIRTETPLSALPNLQNAVTYRNSKRISAQLYLPEGEDGIKIYITRLKVPYFTEIPASATRTSVYSVKDKQLYRTNLATGSSSTILTYLPPCVVHSSSGAPLPMLVSATALPNGHFEVWQPFPVFSDVSGSDVYARQSNGTYYLTTEEEVLYEEAKNSGDYFIIEDMTLTWPIYQSTVKDVAFVTVDEPYTALGTTVNNINGLYARSPGAATETYYSIAPVIPNDTVTISSRISKTGYNHSLSSTAVVEYNGNFWRSLYDEVDSGSFDVVSVTPVENPSGHNNITVGCEMVYIIAPPDRYNDTLANYLKARPGTNYISHYDVIDKKNVRGAITDLIFPYGLDVSYSIRRNDAHIESMLFYASSYGALTGKLFDIEIDAVTTRRLVQKRNAPSTVNLVRRVSGNTAVHELTDNLYLDGSLGQYTITTTVTPTESARLKHLKYDIVHDNLVLKSILLPITYFQFKFTK